MGAGFCLSNTSLEIMHTRSRLQSGSSEHVLCYWTKKYIPPGIHSPPPPPLIPTTDVSSTSSYEKTVQSI